MMGATAGTDKAKGKGGHCSAGIVRRAWGEGGGDGGTARHQGMGKQRCWKRQAAVHAAVDSRSGLTVGDGGTRTAGMGSNGARTSSGKGQITGAAGGILRAKGNGVGAAGGMG